MTTADAIASCLTSPNVSDSNGEAANVVDALDRLSSAGFAIAQAIHLLAAEVAARERQKDFS
jgi:hypothetical protein